jgi:D-3-phosphoglycerate dehydrogenase
MSRFRVLLTDYAWPDVEVERELLRTIDAELVVAPAADAGTLAQLAADVDAILTCWAQVPTAVIEAAPRCRIIARLGVGLDNIDVAAATRRGIAVTNVPDYCVHEVAEHTLALLLALARNIARFHRETKAGRYDRNAGPPLRRIAGQTLGIVGLGHIGREVARRAMGMGLRVIASRGQPVGQGSGPPRTDEVCPTSVRLEADPASASGTLEACPTAELLAQSDYVSLHLPLTPETRHLINAAALARMKPTAYLINTARGGLVDQAALAAALSRDQIAGAALDVQDPEPPDLSQPPFSDPRVIVTPHAAFLSQDSLLELRRRATRQVIDCLCGRTPPNVVNLPAT